MGRRIMIVGNGDIDAGVAEVIDAADLVIRFNTCRSVGAGGGKTDVVAVCNTGRPAKAMLADSAWMCSKAVWLASEIWCVRDSAKFRAMRPELAMSHPELDDFCDDHTDDFAAYARSSGKDFHIIPAATHDALERDLARFAPPPYVVPSSGAVVISEFLTHYRRPDDAVLLAGFGHQGWEWHPWEAERQWVEEMIRHEKLQRLAFSDKYGQLVKVGNT